MSTKPQTAIKRTKTCLFCSKAANSKEHAIPEWLSKRSAIRDFRFRPVHYSEAAGYSVRKNALNAQSLLVRVCDSCNRGWMAELEVWASGAFGSYVEPAWNDIALTEAERLRKDATQLIRWMLKTAIMVEQAGPKGSIPKIVPSLYPVAVGRITPEHFHVWAAHIAKPQFDFRVIRGLPIAINFGKPQYLMHAESMDFSIQLNHLALRLFRCPEASPGLILHNKLKSVEGATLRLSGEYRAAPKAITSTVSYPFPSLPLFRVFDDFLLSLEVHADARASESKG